MNHLCLLTLAALTFDLGLGQNRATYSWLPENLPNPQTDYRACGLSKKGYICDPNGILTKHQRDTLDWFLHGIADTGNSDMCPCSRYHCENFGGPRFYKVAIALVPRLQLPRDTNGVEAKPLNQAQTFAYRLEHDVWNISACREDVVILYSRDDKALVTMTGSTAGRRLTDHSRSIIHGMVGQHFADGRVNEGLLRMVYELDLVLTGRKTYQRGNMAAQTSRSSNVIPSSLLLLFLALTTFLFTRLRLTS